jgi:hypothetical protein
LRAFFGLLDAAWHHLQIRHGDMLRKPPLDSVPVLKWLQWVRVRQLVTTTFSVGQSAQDALPMVECGVE